MMNIDNLFIVDIGVCFWYDRIMFVFFNDYILISRCCEFVIFMVKIDFVDGI